MAQGAGETGVAEAYMCSRIMRDPLVRQCVAEYQGEFIADASAGGFTKGTQWLVWKFESDSTLGDALSVSSSPSACASQRAHTPLDENEWHSPSVQTGSLTEAGNSKS